MATTTKMKCSRCSFPRRCVRVSRIFPRMIVCRATLHLVCNFSDQYLDGNTTDGKSCIQFGRDRASPCACTSRDVQLLFQNFTGDTLLLRGASLSKHTRATNFDVTISHASKSRAKSRTIFRPEELLQVKYVDTQHRRLRLLP